MSSTPFDVVVFDFDGTLVQSAAAKRQAFFEVFPSACGEAVAAVLAGDPDGSRHQVIPAMVAEASRRGLASGLDAAALIEAYGRAADRALDHAAAMPGAEAVLRRAAAGATVYVASMTPHDDLVRFLARRGWLGLVKECFGYPHRKDSVVAMLLARHGIAPGRLLVVGDGISDREAARGNGCAFHAIAGPASLASIPGLKETSDA